MSKTTTTESSQSSTQSKTPFTGATADTFNAGMKKYQELANTSGADYLKNAAANSNYSVGTNAAQDLALKQATNTLGNSNILSYANGDHLDVANDADTQASIARGLKTLQDKWASGIDSTNASMGRAGVGKSSMRINSQNKLADTTQSNMADYQQEALAAAKKEAVSDMMNANTLINNAGTTANQYQQSAQAAKTAALQEALAAKGIDTSTWAGWMQLMQLAANPTVTGNSTGSSTSTTNDPWGTATNLISKISFG